MKQKILVCTKRCFLLLFWFIKRKLLRLSFLGKTLMQKRKIVYDIHMSDFLKFKKESPLNHLSAPPWKLSVSGACLVLGKYVSSQIYHTARSDRWIEIYGFVLGKRLGDLFIGITFFPVTNILRSSNSALPDLEHVSQLKREVSLRFPDLEIVCTVHSHPGGILIPSLADKICFLSDPHPNIIVSPNRLLGGSPIRRLAGFYHSSGKIRRIKLFEIDKKEPELEDMEFKELQPSKEELIDGGELATEVNFDIFKIWVISHPNITLKKLGKKLSEMFGDKISFVFLYRDNEWMFDPNMKVVDFFLKEGDHLVFPEFFEEV